MLVIKIPSDEFWNEKTEELSIRKGMTVKLEHSLVSISKWEAKSHTSFFEAKLTEEMLRDYLACMVIGEVDPSWIDRIRKQDFVRILEYIQDPMTATTITEHGKRKTNKKKEIVTSERVYYWMCKFNIPVEFEKWHINRLIMLIRVCIVEESSGDKMSKSETARYYSAINKANKARFHTRG